MDTHDGSYRAASGLMTQCVWGICVKRFNYSHNETPSSRQLLLLLLSSTKCVRWLVV